MSRRYQYLWLVLVGVGAQATVACDSKREGKFDSTSTSKTATTKSLGLDVQILPARDLFQPWSSARVDVKIKNRSRTPVIIVGLSLKTTGGATVLSDSDTQKQPATISNGEMVVEGRYYVDNVGVAARAARRSYWRWSGKDEVTVFTLLMPLQERKWRGRFRARYEVGDHFRARVRYVPLPKDFRYYSKTKTLRTRSKKPLRQGKMVARWHHIVRFSARSGFPSRPGRPLEVPDPARHRKNKRARANKPEDNETWAIPSSYLESLRTLEIDTTRPLGLRRFAFDIGPARVRAKIAKGPYTRAVNAGVWVLFGKGKSWVVSRDEVLPVEGNALPFANRLNDARRQPVYLFRSAATRDPNGLVSYFKRLGFRVKSRRSKDGTYTGVLELESAKLVSFLKALAKRNLRVDGVDTVAAVR